MNLNDKDPTYLRAHKKVQRIKEFYHHLLVFILINLAIGIGVWYYGGSLKFFIIFCVGGWAIGLVIHALKAFEWNPFLGAKWEQRQLKKMMDKDE